MSPEVWQEPLIWSDKEVGEMKLSADQRKRLDELAREMKEILGGCVAEDGRPLTFDELEEGCIEAGDYVTALVLQERVAKRGTLRAAEGFRERGEEGRFTRT